MADLHVDSYGNGAPLLLIHGWGMHGGMWGNVVKLLAQRFRVLVVDLPGHGYSSGSGERGTGNKQTSSFTLHSIVDELSAQFSEPLTICGWSLGGQIALHWAARHPQQVNRLVLVASTPCFVQQPGWTCAMAAKSLAEFAAVLQYYYAPALLRFLALQVRGSEREREVLADLRESLLSRSKPDLASLQSGLEILRGCDLRSILPEIAQAALVIAGERDTLTPPAASEFLAQKLPNARLVKIPGAAHAPFLSHPDVFMEHVVSFVNE